MNNIRKKGLEKISALLDIELNYSHANHNFEMGLPLEGSLRHFFRPYFPSRYGFSSGYIVDNDDTVSNQTDWIVFDAEHFSPLLANLHGMEGAEWFPFDSVYGCVEVKRTLTEQAFEDAVKQIAATRKLTRTKTDLLQFTPYLRMPEKLLNFAPGATFNEICNTLYSGIYAYLPGDYADPNALYKKLEALSAQYGVANLPDFIAVHSHYYIRRATIKKDGKISIEPFIEQANCFITTDSKSLTAGVFYWDLISQFANTLLSARMYAVGLGSFLRGGDILNVTGRLPYA
jgi:hypothetical protein